MRDNTVVITVTMNIRSGLEDRARGILKGYTGPEDGRLENRMYESLIYPPVFMVYEKWRDEEAYMKYLASPRMRPYDELIEKGLLEGPYDLKRWMPLR